MVLNHGSVRIYVGGWARWDPASILKHPQIESVEIVSDTNLSSQVKSQWLDRNAVRVQVWSG